MSRKIKTENFPTISDQDDDEESVVEESDQEDNQEDNDDDGNEVEEVEEVEDDENEDEDESDQENNEDNEDEENEEEETESEEESDGEEIEIDQDKVEENTVDEKALEKEIRNAQRVKQAQQVKQVQQAKNRERVLTERNQELTRLLDKMVPAENLQLVRDEENRKLQELTSLFEKREQKIVQKMEKEAKEREEYCNKLKTLILGLNTKLEKSRELESSLKEKYTKLIPKLEEKMEEKILSAKIELERVHRLNIESLRDSSLEEFKKTKHEIESIFSVKLHEKDMKLKSFAEEIGNLRKQLHEAKQIKTETVDVNRYTVEIENLRNAIRERDSEIREKKLLLEKQNLEHGEELKILQQKTEQDKKNYKRTLDNANRKLMENEIKIKDLEAKCENLSLSMDSEKRSLFSSLQQKIKKIEEEHKTTVRDNQQLISRLKTVETMYKETKSISDVTESKLSFLEEEKKELIGKIKTLEKEIEKKQYECSYRENDSRENAHDINLLSAKIKEQELLISGFNSTKMGLQQELGILKQVNVSSEALIEKLNGAVRDSEINLNNANQRIAILEMQIKQIKNRPLEKSQEDT